MKKHAESFSFSDKIIICLMNIYLDSGSGSDELMKVEVPIIPWDKCSKQLKDGFNLTNQICAGLDEGGKDACQVRYIALFTKVSNLQV